MTTCGDCPGNGGGGNIGNGAGGGGITAGLAGGLGCILSLVLRVARFRVERLRVGPLGLPLLASSSPTSPPSW